MFFKKNYKNDLYYTAHTTVWIWATKARGKSELLTCFICPHYTQLRRYELRIRKIVLYGSLGKIVYHGLIHFFFYIFVVILPCILLYKDFLSSYVYVCVWTRKYKSYWEIGTNSSNNIWRVRFYDIYLCEISISI